MDGKLLDQSRVFIGFQILHEAEGEQELFVEVADQLGAGQGILPPGNAIDSPEVALDDGLSGHPLQLIIVG